MKKKTRRTLQLVVETIRPLQPVDLQQVAGGAASNADTAIGFSCKGCERQ